MLRACHLISYQIPTGGGDIKAHQRLIRERRAAAGSDEDLFGAWWSGIDTGIKGSVVKEIDTRTARSVILDYEWLGTMPAVIWVSVRGTRPF